MKKGTAEKEGTGESKKVRTTKYPFSLTTKIFIILFCVWMLGLHVCMLSVQSGSYSA